MIILDRERNLNSKDGWGLMDGSPVGGDKFSLNDDTRKCQLGNREWMVAQPPATSEQWKYKGSTTSTDDPVTIAGRQMWAGNWIDGWRNMRVGCVADDDDVLLYSGWMTVDAPLLAKLPLPCRLTLLFAWRWMNGNNSRGAVVEPWNRKLADCVRNSYIRDLAGCRVQCWLIKKRSGVPLGSQKKGTRSGQLEYNGSQIGSEVHVTTLLWIT